METVQIVSIIGCVWLIISFIMCFKLGKKGVVDKLANTIIVFLGGSWCVLLLWAAACILFVMIKTALGL